MRDERARFLAQGDAGLEVAGAPLDATESRPNRRGADTVKVSCVLAPKRLAPEVHRTLVLSSKVERAHAAKRSSISTTSAGRSSGATTSHSSIARSYW